MGKIVKLFGAKQIDAGELTAGDIGAVTKLSGFSTGDTLCSASNVVKLDGVSVPIASYKVAVSAIKKGDEEKIASGIARLCEEDPSLKYTNNIETHQQIDQGCLSTSGRSDNRNTLSWLYFQIKIFNQMLTWQIRE